ncbi:WD40-repeat-containing domain protein [Fimicolochytrium jonesii]|uniref:WD40-repeat-containing domain protein n=1 Tax=Fimicolochytrium jonesii TaxID=1396493 RepID=UPI0022FF2D57|nr:WD40-repeat-containing domain protein [Fimicolochytrium jonesii]KAI8815812.1 WD40-repeat-containing domain protein [Fimicolochytrium jonesii]
MDDFFIADPDAPLPSRNKRKRQFAEQKRAEESAANKRGTAKRAGRRRGEGNDDDDDNSDHEVGGAETVDDMDLVGDRGAALEESEDSEAERESAAQRRLRLAKRYLAKVREEAGADDGEVDAADLDRDIIANRLRDEALEAVGRLHRPIAETFANVENWGDESRVRTFKSAKKPHALPVTAVTVAIPSGTHHVPSSTLPAGYKDTYIYSASKDASIAKWDFWTGKMVHLVPGGLKPTKKLVAAYGSKVGSKHAGHNEHILAIAASSDGQYLATGGRDKQINVWSVPQNKHLTTFKQHRDAVAGLAFRKATSNQLYSASLDRTIKVWNIDEMSYVETLYGHQDEITCVDTLARERCVTTGSRDRTVRLWKIIEESQLIFRGGGSATHEAAGEDLVVMDGLKKKGPAKNEKQVGMAGGSLDAVAMLDEEHFVSGSDTGAISLWNVNRKKPLFTKLKAHGVGSKAVPGPAPGSAAGVAGAAGDDKAADAVDSTSVCGAITSLATVRYSDLFASGSGDGYIRLWKVADSKRRFNLIAAIPMAGFINSLTFLEAPSLPTNPVSSTTDTSNPTSSTTTPTTRLDRARAALASGALSSRSSASQKDTLYLVVGVGQEHRLGRWWRYKGVRNAVKVVTLGNL